jgi:hypothetical protein
LNEFPVSVSFLVNDLGRFDFDEVFGNFNDFHNKRHWLSQGLSQIFAASFAQRQRKSVASGFKVLASRGSGNGERLALRQGVASVLRQIFGAKSQNNGLQSRERC